MSPSATARYRTFHHMDIRTLPGRDRRYRCIPLDHRPIPAFPGPVRTARHNSRASPYPTSSTPLDEQSSSDVEGEVSATQHAHPAVPPVIGTVAGHSAPQAGGNEASSSQSSAVSLPGRHRRQPASMAVDDSYPLEDLIDALDKLEWDNTQSASVKDWIARQVDMTLNPARKFSKQSEHSVRKICEEAIQEFTFLRDYEDCWPVMHLIRIHLAEGGDSTNAGHQAAGSSRILRSRSAARSG